MRSHSVTCQPAEVTFLPWCSSPFLFTLFSNSFRALSRRHRRHRRKKISAGRRRRKEIRLSRLGRICFQGLAAEKKSASRKPYSLKTGIFRFGMDLGHSLVSQTSPLYQKYCRPVPSTFCLSSIVCLSPAFVYCDQTLQPIKMLFVTVTHVARETLLNGKGAISPPLRGS